jgi:hypothetical protein
MPQEKLRLVEEQAHMHQESVTTKEECLHLVLEEDRQCRVEAQQEAER